MKENQKSCEKRNVKPIIEQIKTLLMTMFLNGNVDKRKRMNTQEMYNELTDKASQGEFNKDDIPKVSTIHNWILERQLRSKYTCQSLLWKRPKSPEMHKSIYDKIIKLLKSKIFFSQI